MLPGGKGLNSIENEDVGWVASVEIGPLRDCPGCGPVDEVDFAVGSTFVTTEYLFVLLSVPSGVEGLVVAKDSNFSTPREWVELCF